MSSLPSACGGDDEFGVAEVTRDDAIILECMQQWFLCQGQALECATMPDADGLDPMGGHAERTVQAGLCVRCQNNRWLAALYLEFRETGKAVGSDDNHVVVVYRALAGEVGGMSTPHPAMLSGSMISQLSMSRALIPHLVFVETCILEENAAGEAERVHSSAGERWPLLCDCDK